MGLAFNVAMLLVALLTVGLQQTSGEVLPRYGHSSCRPKGPTLHSSGAWLVLGRGSVPAGGGSSSLPLSSPTTNSKYSDRILHEMNRGVTALSGIGMYRREPHTVLMCALTVTEVPFLKALVKDPAQHPKAFVYSHTG